MLAHLHAQLQALSPQATLDRGYAIAVRTDGSVLRDATHVGVGDQLVLRLARGQVLTTVDAVDTSKESTQ
ncbi:MAG: exodeoxyribonuclease VII large subunit [Actinomycetales bacterium]